MARITIEDCLTQIPNRFELTLTAAYRSRQITVGATPQIELDRHQQKEKPTVIALREIAAGKIGVDLLRRMNSNSHQR